MPRSVPSSEPDGPRAGYVSGITPQETLRIIGFLKELRRPFDGHSGIAETDATWNITACLIEASLAGRPVTNSALTAASGLPYATAQRRLHAMIDAGLIERVPKGHDSSRHFLVPSRRMLAEFEDYCVSVKGLLARTIALSEERPAEEFYFGGGGAERALPSPAPQSSKLLNSRSKLSFLVNDDNYFASMRNLWSDYRTNLGSRSDFTLQSLDGLYDAVRDALEAPKGSYDIVTLDKPWTGDLATRGLLRPLDDYITPKNLQPFDFHPAVWASGAWDGVQYGIPIYTTIELLAARRDLFEGARLDYPDTFDDVVAAAKQLHRPKDDVYGIGWNCAPGLPIASTFMILMGCCGTPIIKVPPGRRNYNWSSLRPEQLRPNIAGEAGMMVLDFLHRLMPWSPPGIERMTWDDHVEAFLSGHLAMSYCWSMRAARFEYDIASRVKRKVAYLPQPRAPGGISANPMGGFHLAIPRNISEERAKLAFEAIAWLASPESMKRHVTSGIPVAPRFSVASDPEVAKSSPVIHATEALARRGLVCAWQRPPLPEYREIEAVLGRYIHAAVMRELSDRQALDQAQDAIDRIMRENGRY